MRIIVCANCDKETEHYGKGLCKKCYLIIYRNSARYKKRHAEQERKRRERLADRYQEQEVARNKTEKRILWRRRYNPFYYKENRDRLLAYQRSYRKNNRDKINEADRIRKKIKREDKKYFSEKDWHDVLERYGWRCYYCRVELNNPEQDHKLPITRGGRATVDNIVPSCHPCNCRKNDRTVDEYRDYLISIGEEPLF